MTQTVNKPDSYDHKDLEVIVGSQRVKLPDKDYVDRVFSYIMPEYADTNLTRRLTPADRPIVLEESPPLKLHPDQIDPDQIDTLSMNLPTAHLEPLGLTILNHSLGSKKIRTHSWVSRFFSQLQGGPSPDYDIIHAESHEEVLNALRRRNLDQYVDDYHDCLRKRIDDLEEGESPGIILQSLQSWARFIADYADQVNLPRVQLRADFDGCARLMWRLSERYIPGDPDNQYWGNGRGIATLKFYPSRLNYFSLLSGPLASGKRRITSEGYLTHDKTKRTIDLYAERFLNEDRKLAIRQTTP